MRCTLVGVGSQVWNSIAVMTCQTSVVKCISSTSVTAGVPQRKRLILSKPPWSGWFLREESVLSWVFDCKISFLLSLHAFVPVYSWKRGEIRAMLSCRYFWNCFGLALITCGCECITVNVSSGDRVHNMRMRVQPHYLISQWLFHGIHWLYSKVLGFSWQGQQHLFTCSEGLFASAGGVKAWHCLSQ